AGAGPLPAVVGQVRVTVTLDRRLAFPAAVAAAATVPPPAVLQGGLELVPLAAAGPVHAADQLGPRAVLIRPEVRIGTRLERVEFARPQVGDLVEVSWTGAPAPRLHRVVHVDGAAATLDAEGGALPVNTPGLTVQRLDAADPRNGTTRSGRAGDLLALRADQSDLRADVWQPNALQAGDRVAVTDGTRAFPARVVARTRLDVAWLPGPALDAAATTVTITAPALAGAPVLVPAAAQEGADVVLDGTTGMLAAGPNLVLAVDYGDERTAAAGTFDAGSVLVPDEPAVELTRHQALVDHEMAHTVQSAIWGPILLSPFPFRGLEEIIEAAGHPYPPALHHIGKLYSVGGLMNFLTSTIVSGVAWVVFKLVAFFVRLFSGQPLSPGWLGHADWLPFHAATIPDAANPRRIRLAAAGQPALSAGDLVEVTAGESYTRATVEVVDGTAVELDSPAPSGEGLQIALVAEGDETSLVEHAVARHTGFGALEVPFDVYFDPWSQISNRGDLAPGSFEDVLFRAARDLFGSSSWTLFPFGYFFWDNALRNRSGEGHLSKMEQSASEQSGENYSAIGRLDGRLEVVGDVARYWHFVEWRHDTALLGAGGDSPGPHGQDLLRVMPSAREDPGVVSEPPNEQVDAAPDAERPGAQVADVFTARDPGDPLAANVPAGATPRGFRPGARGAVPVGPRVERCVGAYVAFTRPPAAGPPATTHRISSVNRFSGADRSLQARQAGKQTIL
ncbi:MAG TPA: hypothetical protein VLB47_08360, partial [Solirubrobacteraceae bacterium]|nr:hypothetical protein [Solirubrobacteraceae bacterium]